MKKLGVSRNTARSRLQRLVDEGIATMDTTDHDKQVYSLIGERPL